MEGEPTSRHVAYCMARIELLLGAGVTPLVVFDGGRLPNKADEERSRERNREENKSRARQLWQQGNKAAAMECYQKAVDISPSHAKQFVEVGAAGWCRQGTWLEAMVLICGQALARVDDGYGHLLPVNPVCRR